MPLETAITDSILKYLNGLPDCIAEKVHGSIYQFGRPDINACIQGRSVRIEVKSPDHGNKPSKAQKLDMKKWRKAGAVCFVAYSLADVKRRIFEEG